MVLGGCRSFLLLVTTLTQAEGLIFYSVQKQVKAVLFEMDYKLCYTLENTINAG